jgi:hypothetical protein
MKKDEVLKYIESKGDADFVIRTGEEDKTFLENYGKKIEEEVIPTKISELHNRYDDDVFAVTGLKKNPTEKTYDFVKRVLASYKTDAEKASTFTKEIADLKKQIADGTGDKKTLQDLEAMQKAYNDLQATKDKEITTLKTDYDKYKIRTEIMSATSGMVCKKGIPESVVNAYVNQVINELTGMASYQDGKLVFMKDGVPMRNTFNALNPYTAKELVEEKLKEIRETGKQSPGGPGISTEIVKEYDKTSGKLSKVAMVIPDSVKNKQDLSKYLIGQKLLRGTEEYNLAYKEYSQNLPFA